MMPFKWEVTRWLLTCSILTMATTAYAEQVSKYASLVGIVGDDDATTWCVPTIETDPFTQREYATGSLEKRAPDGTIIGGVIPSQLTMKVKMRCNPWIGSGQTVSSANWSQTPSTPQCPSGTSAEFLMCQIRDTSASPIGPFVYDGSACGGGVFSFEVAEFTGQMTGNVPEMFFSWLIDDVFNADQMTEAEVIGTDLGSIFYQGGKLYFTYGDTWANQDNRPDYPDWKDPSTARGCVVFSTEDFDPSDSNGIEFDSWHGAPGRAEECIDSPHDYAWDDELGDWGEAETEFTAIPSAGFGITAENGDEYRILWFQSFKDWQPLDIPFSTLAWSVNGNDFVRAYDNNGDKNPAAGSFDPPKWSDRGWLQDTGFITGTVWHDRYEGYIYFFGRGSDLEDSGIRVARVKANIDSIMHKEQYAYWNGFYWQFDSNGDYEEAETNWFAEIIHSSPQHILAGNFSVTFNSHVNRFIFLTENLYTTLFPYYFLGVWQSPAFPDGDRPVITGSWQELDNSRLAEIFGPYAPLSHDFINPNGGEVIYYQVSEWAWWWYPYTQPYNVGLWKNEVNAINKYNCER